MQFTPIYSQIQRILFSVELKKGAKNKKIVQVQCKFRAASNVDI